VRVIAVNRFVMPVLFFLAACHLGRPPTPATRFKVGQVIAPVAEPALTDALKGGLAVALSTRTMLSQLDGEEVNIAVLAATSMQTGVGPTSQIHTARLQFSVQVGDRRSQFSAERSFSVIDTVQGAAARAAAFADLANHLTGDAAIWIGTAPTKPEEKEHSP
jgi:hypothetical protein